MTFDAVLAKQRAYRLKATKRTSLALSGYFALETYEMEKLKTLKKHIPYLLDRIEAAKELSKYVTLPKLKKAAEKRFVSSVALLIPDFEFAFTPLEIVIAAHLFLLAFR